MMEVQGHNWKEGSKDKKIRAERLSVEGDLIKYTGNGRGIGVYVSQEAITTENNYFELSILNTDMFGAVSIGVCHVSYPLNKMPGWAKDSLGYHGDDGMLYRGNALGFRFGPRCGKGDRMGCGVRPVPAQELSSPPTQHQQTHYVYFTKNGKEIGCVSVDMPQGGLYPCVGLAGPQDVVRLGGPFPPPSPGPVILSPHSPPTPAFGEDAFMAVDYNEDDWRRLHDVKLNGQCVSYCGRGQQIEDVGLAVAKHPLSPSCHYFQLQIVDPGRHAYITIGITKKSYPTRCHPGWRHGSVAYHADDGRVFTGNNSGWGTHFGPPCGRGDIMGCGILFPRDYSHSSYVNNDDSSGRDESDDCPDNVEGDESSSEGEEDELCNSGVQSPLREGHNIVNSVAALESPEMMDPLVMPQYCFEDPRHEEADMLDEEQELRKHLRTKRKYGKRRGGGGGAPPPKMDHHSNGFINRNSVLLKDLHPQCPDKGGEGEPVVQVFFTRNGALLGRVEALVPRGGFYPTISLGGKKETVRVDLRPLSG